MVIFQFAMLVYQRVHTLSPNQPIDRIFPSHQRVITTHYPPFLTNIDVEYLPKSSFVDHFRRKTGKPMGFSTSTSQPSSALPSGLAALGHRISTSPGNIPRSDQLKAQQKDDSNTHRIHGAAINGNMYHQYTPNVSIYTSTMDPMG